MEKSFIMLQDICLSQMRRSGDPDLRNWTKFWLNEEMMDFWSNNDLPAFNHRFSITLDTTVQSDLTTFQEAPAPCDVGKLIQAELYDATETVPTHTKVEILPLMEFERRFMGKNPADDSPGTAVYVALRRTEGIRNPILGAEAYTVESTSTQDTDEVTFISYSDALMQTRTKNTVNLAGQTPVALGTAYEAISLTKVGPTLGNVVVKRGAVTVLEIEPWEVSAYYSVYQFYPYADDSYTFKGVYKRRPPLMSANSDVPLGIPDNALEILIQGTVMKGLQLIEDSDWTVAKALKEEAELKFYRSLRGIGEEQDFARVEFPK